MTERLQASDVFATLNEHTERVSRIVQEFGGTIVKLNGDGFVRHEALAIRGRRGRFDVFALPLP